MSKKSNAQRRRTRDAQAKKAKARATQTRSRSMFGWVAAIVVFVLVVGVAVATRSTTPAAADVIPAADRESAPDIAGPTIQGSRQKVALSQFRGKPVVVQVWASWCEVCGAEAPELREFENRNKDVEVLGINVQDSPDNALAFKRHYGLNHRFDLSDEDRSIAGALGLYGQPNTVVIDSEGRIAAVIQGSTTRDSLENIVGSL